MASVKDCLYNGIENNQTITLCGTLFSENGVLFIELPNGKEPLLHDVLSDYLNEPMEMKVSITSEVLVD